MKRILILFFSLFLCFSIFSNGKSKIDSLHKILSSHPHDSIIIQTNYNIGLYYYDNDLPDSSYIYFTKSLILSQKTNYKNYILKSAKELGYFYTDAGETDSSLKYFKIAVAVYEQEDPLQYDLFSGLGNAYYFKGDFVKAYECYLKSLKLAEINKKPSSISRAYSNVGVALKEQKKFKDALVFFNKSLEIADKNDLKTASFIAFINIGNIYSELFGIDKSKYNYEMTLQYYLKARDFIEQNPNSNVEIHSIILMYGNIGNTYADVKEYDKALKEFDKALSLIEKHGEFTSVSLLYNNLASIYIDIKKASLAKKYLDLARKAAIEISGSVNEVMENYGTTSRYFELIDNYKMAYLYQLRFKKMSDSLFSTENAEKRKEIELNAQYEKKELAERIEQEKKDLLESEERKKQLILRNALITGFVLMLVVAFLIFRGYRQKQKSNEIIIQQKMEVEKQKEIIEVKQKEILDSIHYAKRIQQSLMPTKKYIDRNLSKLKDKEKI